MVTVLQMSWAWSLRTPGRHAGEARCGHGRGPGLESRTCGVRLPTLTHLSKVQSQMTQWWLLPPILPPGGQVTRGPFHCQRAVGRSPLRVAEGSASFLQVGQAPP